MTIDRCVLDRSVPREHKHRLIIGAIFDIVDKKIKCKPFRPLCALETFLNAKNHYVKLSSCLERVLERFHSSVISSCKMWWHAKQRN